MPGIIGTKIGMTAIFDPESKKSIACTLIQAGPCPVTQIKTKEGKDGYNAVQIGFGVKKEKNSTKAELGHLKKANQGPLRILREFNFNPANYKLGDLIEVTFFNEGEKIEVVGTSKGKGFQGVVKRHGFAGVGGQTHGQHNRLRAPGSIGACSFPSRVFKGMRMGGHMGTDRVKLKNLKVLKVYAEKNLILVSGSVPGAKGSIVYIQK